jgi:D-glycero-alpha-D-manno-heptose 1-phosphate guanylyltransferase
MEAIILAGGKGTRLRPLTLTVPKPMVPVAEKPFLHYLLKMLIGEGVTRVILSVGYLGEQIKDYFGESWLGLEISYVLEKEPLGTGGAISKCLTKVNGEEVIVINGDTYCRIDLKEMISSHRERHAELTIALKEMFDFDRYGTVDCDMSTGVIKQFNEKRKVSEGYINTGTYCLNKDIFRQYNMPDKFSFEADFLQTKINEINTNVFKTSGYFIDIGIQEDYQRFQKEVETGWGDNLDS